MESLIPASSKKRMLQKSRLIDGIKNNLSLSSILLLGATLQIILSLLPIRPFYTLGPAIILLIARFTQTMLITYGVLPNPYLEGIVPKRFTAQVRDLDGNFTGPGQERIAVLLLGAKSNHPLGIFAPGFPKLGEYLGVMNKELETDQTQESGFLGSTAFNHIDANGANEFVFMSYWRSLDDVHRYAHGPTHRMVWNWWDREVSKKYKHIGIMHEVYEADKSSYESVYQNFQPSMLASTTYLKREGKMVGGEVEEEWVSPIFEASKANMGTSNARRGVGDKKEVADFFAKREYA